MTHYIVSMEKVEWAGLMDKLPPSCRFTNVEEWHFPHFWMYSPSGDVVIFTSEPVVQLESKQLRGVLK